MIAINTERFSRCELVGLEVNIIESSNPLHLGMNGLVVDETKNMLVISNNKKKRNIPKENTTYSFTLSDGTFLVINGRQLLGRPFDRIGKTSGRRKC